MDGGQHTLSEQSTYLRCVNRKHEENKLHLLVVAVDPVAGPESMRSGFTTGPAVP